MFGFWVGDRRRRRPRRSLPSLGRSGDCRRLGRRRNNPPRLGSLVRHSEKARWREMGRGAGLLPVDSSWPLGRRKHGEGHPGHDRPPPTVVPCGRRSPSSRPSLTEFLGQKTAPQATLRRPPGDRPTENSCPGWRAGRRGHRPDILGPTAISPITGEADSQSGLSFGKPSFSGSGRNCQEAFGRSSATAKSFLAHSAETRLWNWPAIVLLGRCAAGPSQTRRRPSIGPAAGRLRGARDERPRFRRLAFRLRIRNGDLLLPQQHAVLAGESSLRPVPSGVPRIVEQAAVVVHLALVIAIVDGVSVRALAVGRAAAEPRCVARLGQGPQPRRQARPGRSPPTPTGPTGAPIVRAATAACGDDHRLLVFVDRGLLPGGHEQKSQHRRVHGSGPLVVWWRRRLPSPTAPVG